MAHILIIGDRADLLRELEQTLGPEGHRITIAGSGEDGLGKLLNLEFDLVLLESALSSIGGESNLGGLDVCRKARDKGVTTPILMLAEEDDDTETISASQECADDFITRPFGLRELLSRMKILLRRRPAPGTTDPVQIGRIEVDFSTYTATESGSGVSLTTTEFELLRYLHDNIDSVIDRERLLCDVWGYEESIPTRSVDNFILKLRQKIETDPSEPRVILTVHGIGYKLIQ